MELEHPAALAGPPIDWAALRRILVVRPDNLGDVVLSGPALRALRRAAPRARLDLLAAPAGAAVAPLLPEVGEVLVASVSWQQLDPAAVPAEEDLALLDRIRAGRYDAAVLLTSFTQSPWPAAQLCRLAGVPVRVGTSKEFGGAALTHWVPSPPDELHQVDRALRVLARVGVPPVDGRLRLVVPDEARAAGRRVLAQHGVTGPYAVLLPGASCSSRRYPVDRFAEVAGLLAAAGLPVLVSGTAAESEPVSRVAGNRPGVLAAAGELDVPALAAALAGARVVSATTAGARTWPTRSASPRWSCSPGPSSPSSSGPERCRPRCSRFRRRARPADNCAARTGSSAWTWCPSGWPGRRCGWPVRACRPAPGRGTGSGR